jgi:hypothetical protein
MTNCFSSFNGQEMGLYLCYERCNSEIVRFLEWDWQPHVEEQGNVNYGVNDVCHG